MDKQTKEQIRDLVANARLDKALEVFGTWAESKGDNDIQNTILLKKGQLRKLRSDENLGLLNTSDARMQNAQISHAILSMLDAASSEKQVYTISKISPKQKTLLFMGANPPNTRSLQLEVEHSRISAKLNNVYKIEVEKFTSASDIPELIVSKEPNIIHFSGHGKDPNSGEAGEKDRAIGYVLPENYDQKGGIVVFDDDMRQMKVVDDDVLDYLFGAAVNELGISIEVVVFNSCHSESQAKVICKYVGYVVGTARAISDDVAIAFASGFYFALGQGKSVEKAFTTGKMQAVIKDIKARDLIVLYKNGERQKM
ncbi:MAG: CHAT domain-containing protein [Saprospiraceae bacterium]|nr:CHAT domain-containing protein [Saprospiraceae bacterium]